jgi:hypothetical protein
MRKLGMRRLEREVEPLQMLILTLSLSKWEGERVGFSAAC